MKKYIIPFTLAATLILGTSPTLADPYIDNADEVRKILTSYNFFIEGDQLPQARLEINRDPKTTYVRRAFLKDGKSYISLRDLADVVIHGVKGAYTETEGEHTIIWGTLITSTSTTDYVAKLVVSVGDVGVSIRYYFPNTSHIIDISSYEFMTDGLKLVTYKGEIYFPMALIKDRLPVQVGWDNNSRVVKVWGINDRPDVELKLS